MAWALGIANESNKLVAELLDASGDVTVAPLKQLATVGTVPGFHRMYPSVVTQFSDWTPKSSEEYLTELGIALPKSSHCRHTVFEFNVARTRFLVPALAVMRALFRPKKFLLPTMFLPQALDRTAFINHSAPESPTLTVNADWALTNPSLMTRHIYDALAWMFSAPSARVMAGSVHTAAIAGHIDLQLPLGKAWVAVKGTRIYDTYFCSEISIQHIQTTEPVGLTKNSDTGHIALLAKRTLDEDVTFIPTRSNGTIELTEEEWNVIRPILLAQMKIRNIKRNQCEIFNGILTKLHTGLSWSRIKYRDGTVTHAIHAYRTWKRNGTLAAVQAKLIELRLNHNNKG